MYMGSKWILLGLLGGGNLGGLLGVPCIPKVRDQVGVYATNLKSVVHYWIGLDFVENRHALAVRELVFIFKVEPGSMIYCIESFLIDDVMPGVFEFAQQHKDG